MHSDKKDDTRPVNKHQKFGTVIKKLLSGSDETRKEIQEEKEQDRLSESDEHDIITTREGSRKTPRKFPYQK